MQKVQCVLKGSRVIDLDGIHIKTNNLKMTQRHFKNHSFFWVDHPGKKITKTEKAVMLLQKDIDFLTNTFADFIEFNEKSVIKAEKRQVRRRTKYVAIINNRSVYITEKVYYLFPKNNIINMSQETAKKTRTRKTKTNGKEKRN